MKLKNSQIVTFLNTGFAKKKLPIKLSFAIMRNNGNMQAAATAYNTATSELREKYPANENGELPAEFWNELSELQDIETEVNVDTVTLEDMEKTDQEGFDSITLEEVVALSFMIA